MENIEKASKLHLHAVLKVSYLGIEEVLLFPSSTAGLTWECKGELNEKLKAKLVCWMHTYAQTGQSEESPPLIFPKMTPFQQKVIKAICAIPKGQVKTYRDIALIAGHPNAYRAVGNVCHRNCLALFVPCHRVVGVSHSLTGYAFGLGIKQQLLAHEGAILS